MIDHLFSSTKPIALDSLGIVLPEDTEFIHKVGATAQGTFGSIVTDVVGIKVIQRAAKPDDEGLMITKELIASGFWLTVRSRTIIKEYKADPRCVVITNESLASEGKPCVHYRNINYPWRAFQATVWPTYNGSKYPFGPHMNESQLIGD